MLIELSDRDSSIVVHALIRFSSDNDHPDAAAAGSLALRIGRAKAEARRLVVDLAERSGDWTPAPEPDVEDVPFSFDGPRYRGGFTDA